MIEQVAEPAVSWVAEVHAEPVQSTVPAGVPPGPLTVAVKTKVPPVAVVPWLSATVTVEVASPDVTVVRGEEVALKSVSPALVAVTKQVPAEVELSEPEVMAQPEAEPPALTT